MGLDFSHGDAGWSYSGFNRFRERVANSLGIEFSQMEGFGGKAGWNGVEKGIACLLNHSDCEGELSVEEMKLLIPSLKKIVNKWEKGDFDRQMALRLTDGMKDAIEANEPIIFC